MPGTLNVVNTTVRTTDADHLANRSFVKGIAVADAGSAAAATERLRLYTKAVYRVQLLLAPLSEVTSVAALSGLGRGGNGMED